MDSILTKQQKQALCMIANTDLATYFYFSGETALSHYYLQHRYSEDLDFFNQEEFDPQSITILLKKLQKKLKFDWHIDPLQLASRLFEVDTHLDDPIIDGNFDRKGMTNYFQAEAERMKDDVLE